MSLSSRYGLLGRHHGNEVNGTYGQDKTSVKHDSNGINPGSRGKEPRMLTSELHPRPSVQLVMIHGMKV